MIVTFYSYKGGVGRSMALANVASWLAAQGLRVAIVDWDLEAPGIEAYFERSPSRLSELRKARGLLDLLAGYRDLYPTIGVPEPTVTQTSDITDREAAAASLRHRVATLRDAMPGLGLTLQPVGSAPRPSRQGRDSGIWILTAGAREGTLFADYARRVHGFDWSGLYTSSDGTAFFLWLREELETYADITLIDSRTGVTEMSGVCTRGMADLVVSMCAANRSNLDGALRMHRWFREPAAAELRGRPLPALIVPSRVDGRVETAELLRFKEQFIQATRSLGDVDPDVAPEDWWELQIGYVSLYSFQERVVIGQRGESEYLQQDYDRLSRHIAQRFIAHSPDARVELTRRSLGPLLRDLLTETGLTPARQAEAAFAALELAQQQRAIRLLTRFVKLARDDEGGGATAIQVPESKFDPADRPLLQQLASVGLVASDTSEDGRVFRLEQPRLIDEWTRLSGVIAVDRGFLFWRQHVSNTQSDWTRYQNPAFLLTGEALEEAREWRQARSDDLLQAEQEFIIFCENVAPGQAVGMSQPVASRLKTLVVFAGVSGAENDTPARTNVARLFRAVDLTEGAQVAYFDDGLTAATFKPMAWVANLVGWGLKRSVLEQYRFLCSHYQNGDRIVAIGAGSGAFRVRVLVSLIADQGLVSGVRGRELERLTQWAYRQFRRRFTTRVPIGPLRQIRDFLLRLVDRVQGHAPYDNGQNRIGKVTFLGLWDTTDPHYFLPLEVRSGWDQWVWPLSVCDPQISPIVEKVCHAVAVDEDREALAPLLVDESRERLSSHIDEDRVMQVWFAGGHESVCGGRSNDSLAYVPLRWMAGEAEKQGLKLLPHATEEWAGRADPLGPLTSTRTGLNMTYRYGPRDIHRLTEAVSGSYRSVRIHEGVFQRIVQGRQDYAPLGIPARYGVLAAQGQVRQEGTNPYERPTQAMSRSRAQERVWDLVWVRRVLYFATVITTLLVVLPPLLLDEDSRGILRFSWGHSRFLENLVELLGNVVPGALQPLIAYYRTKPDQLFVPAILIGLMMFASSRVQRAAADRMRALWTGGGNRDEPHGFIYKLRTHVAYRRTIWLITQHIFPFVFGMLALPSIVFPIAGTLNRAVFTLANVAGVICSPGSDARTPLERVVGTIHREFDNRNPCTFTNVELEGGVAYRATFRIGKGKGDAFTETGTWFDKTTRVDSPEGFSTGDNFFVAPFLPFRRVLTARWFVPIIRIGDYSLGGSSGVEYRLLNKREPIEFTPAISGRMVLFVNDAIGPLPRWNVFYENNDGGIGQVEITKARVGTPASQPTQTGGSGLPVAWIGLGVVAVALLLGVAFALGRKAAPPR